MNITIIEKWDRQACQIKINQQGKITYKHCHAKEPSVEETSKVKACSQYAFSQIENFSTRIAALLTDIANKDLVQSQELPLGSIEPQFPDLLPSAPTLYLSPLFPQITLRAKTVCETFKSVALDEKDPPIATKVFIGEYDILHIMHDHPKFGRIRSTCLERYLSNKNRLEACIGELSTAILQYPNCARSIQAVMHSDRLRIGSIDKKIDELLTKSTAESSGRKRKKIDFVTISDKED